MGSFNLQLCERWQTLVMVSISGNLTGQLMQLDVHDVTVISLHLYKIDEQHQVGIIFILFLFFKVLLYQSGLYEMYCDHALEQIRFFFSIHAQKICVDGGHVGSELGKAVTSGDSRYICGRSPNFCERRDLQQQMQKMFSFVGRKTFWF